MKINPPTVAAAPPPCLNIGADRHAGLLGVTGALQRHKYGTRTIAALTSSPGKPTWAALAAVAPRLCKLRRWWALKVRGLVRRQLDSHYRRQAQAAIPRPPLCDTQLAWPAPRAPAPVNLGNLGTCEFGTTPPRARLAVVDRKSGGQGRDGSALQLNVDGGRVPAQGAGGWKRVNLGPPSSSSMSMEGGYLHREAAGCRRASCSAYVETQDQMWKCRANDGGGCLHQGRRRDADVQTRTECGNAGPAMEGENLQRQTAESHTDAYVETRDQRCRSSVRRPTARQQDIIQARKLSWSTCLRAVQQQACTCAAPPCCARCPPRNGPVAGSKLTTCPHQCNRRHPCPPARPRPAHRPRMPSPQEAVAEPPCPQTAKRQMEKRLTCSAGRGEPQHVARRLPSWAGRCTGRPGRQAGCWSRRTAWWVAGGGGDGGATSFPVGKTASGKSAGR